MLWVSCLFFNFCILALIFVIGPQALSVNPGCLIKSCLLFHSFYILHQLANTSKTKQDPLKEFYLKVFIAKLLINLVTSLYLINFNFLPSHTSHFDKRFILPFFVFTNLRFLLSLFFLHFKNIITLFHKLKLLD